MHDNGVCSRSGRGAGSELGVGNPTLFFERSLNFPSNHVFQHSNEGNFRVHCPRASHKGILRRGGTASRPPHRTVAGDVWSAAHTDLLTLDIMTVVPN
jgi:hypothetical protein